MHVLYIKLSDTLFILTQHLSPYVCWIRQVLFTLYHNAEYMHVFGKNISLCIFQSYPIVYNTLGETYCKGAGSQRSKTCS